MAITLSVDFTGTPDEWDINAGKRIVDAENTRRSNLETPLPALPYSTKAELKASYLTALSFIVQNAHASYIQQAQNARLLALKNDILNATDAQIAQIEAIFA